jgi:lysophospholipase L1-like esterase
MRSNAQLAAAYPDNYIDIHRILVNAYNPNDPQDVADFNNDITPTSLRFDRIHLNTAGCDLVAAQIKQFLAAKGW